MARGDDLHAIKYLPLKLKGPARHWLNSLPQNSIGSWEDLEEAFLDNFQGTYVRPPDADDLSHIVQQPGESARKFWTRFLTKKNQIVDCPDAEALAAFKHSIRDEWLARHLGQEKPKSMAALTALMTRFCAGEDSWLARSNNTASETGPSEAKNSTDKPRRNRHKRRSNDNNTDDTTVNAGFSGPNPVNGRSLTKEITEDLPAWTVYSTVRARYMAPQTSKPIIPTGIVGFSSRLAS
jgi:hypothetical protein